MRFCSFEGFENFWIFLDLCSFHLYNRELLLDLFTIFCAPLFFFLSWRLKSHSLPVSAFSLFCYQQLVPDRISLSCRSSHCSGVNFFLAPIGHCLHALAFWFLSPFGLGFPVKSHSVPNHLMPFAFSTIHNVFLVIFFRVPMDSWQRTGIFSGTLCLNALAFWLLSSLWEESTSIALGCSSPMLYCIRLQSRDLKCHTLFENFHPSYVSKGLNYELC